MSCAVSLSIPCDVVVGKVENRRPDDRTVPVFSVCWPLMIDGLRQPELSRDLGTPLGSRCFLTVVLFTISSSYILHRPPLLKRRILWATHVPFLMLRRFKNQPRALRDIKTKPNIETRGIVSSTSSLQMFKSTKRRNSFHGEGKSFPGDAKGAAYSHGLQMCSWFSETLQLKQTAQMDL